MAVTIPASVRESTRQRAVGMTLEQVSAATEQARALERLRMWASSSQDDQEMIREIEQSHEEWLRIAVLMSARRMPTYQLEGDPLARMQLFAGSTRGQSERLPDPAVAAIPAQGRSGARRARSVAAER